MNHEKLNQALEEISDSHLLEAASEQQTPRLPWLWAAAAVLILASFAAGLLSGVGQAPSPNPTDPLTLETVPKETAPPAQQLDLSGELPGNVALLGLVAGPEYPQMEVYPADPNDFEQYQLWSASQRAQYDQPEGYADSLDGFFANSLPLLLDAGQENAVCSPVNIYTALAMLAECTDGNSRQQILDLLGADSIETLRQQAGHVWNAHYCFDGKSTSILGSSLWLDDACVYNADTVNLLSQRYYASVFQGQLGSDEMNEALQGWLNDQTGGLLKEQVQNQQFSEDTVLALATTIFYRAGWQSGFSESRSTTEIFHAPNGDISWAFMNRTVTQGTYYQGEDYGAVALSLEDGSRMWLVLPNEGTTPADVLSSGYAADMILTGEGRDAVEAQIHLSVPRFDVCAETDLVPVLQRLGITDAFSDTAADFSSIMPDANSPDYRVYLGKADHAARVAVDEEGVTAAAYTVMYMYATGMPQEPELEIDFVLDRPFLFIITSADGLPTFAGVVNQP